MSVASDARDYARAAWRRAVEAFKAGEHVRARFAEMRAWRLWRMAEVLEQGGRGRGRKRS